MDSSRQLFLLVALLLLCGRGCDSVCSSGNVKCKTSDKCISYRYVCDNTNHCEDGSDENRKLCEMWPFGKYPCGSNAVCQNSCYGHSDFCNRENCASTVDPKVCKVIKERTLDIHEEEGMILSEESVALLTSVVNSTVTQRRGGCPMLYTQVGNKCLAFFSLAKVPWPEARQFCKSIFGDLASFSSFEDFLHISDYLKDNLLTSDYWLGGRYDMDQNSWSWASDDTPMPLGTPYWAQRYSSTCVRRPPPHTDPFVDPPVALPNAPCSFYVQAPRNRQQGWCSAMTYENFYYLSDEDCQESLSPLCVLTYQPLE